MLELYFCKFFIKKHHLQSFLYILYIHMSVCMYKTNILFPRDITDTTTNIDNTNIDTTTNIDDTNIDTTTNKDTTTKIYITQKYRCHNKSR